MAYDVSRGALVDRLDAELIGLLGRDARQSSRVLARQLKVSAATVRRRLRRLIADGVLHIQAMVDPEKGGRPLGAIIAFDISRDKLDPIMKTLCSRPEIQWVATTTGRFDILALARFSSTGELSNFLQGDLIKVEGIRDSETFLCLRVAKGHLLGP